MQRVFSRTNTTHVGKLPIAVAFSCLGIWQAVAADEPARPAFKDGEAQVVKAFSDADYWIREDLWVMTEFDSDGDGKLDRMHVSVTRPRQTESEGLKLPAIYISSPYFGGKATKTRDYFWQTRQQLGDDPPARESMADVKPAGQRPIISKKYTTEWVPRGFGVVHSSSPGTGLSQGCPTIGADNESLAPKAVIDWLCGRAKGYSTPDGEAEVHAAWCTGKVGMTGVSFNGTLALAAATTGVDGLEAIIPVAPNTSYYHYYRSNGLIRHPYGYMGEDIDFLYDYVHSHQGEQRDYCDTEVRDNEMLDQFDRVTGDYNDFWAGRDYIHDLKPVKAAMLMGHAFNDWNVMPEHSVRIYEALKQKGVAVQAFFAQGGHGVHVPKKLMNRWFTHYLHGIDNGVEKDPRAWIVRENDAADKPTSYADYPHPEATHADLYPTAGAPERGSLSLSPSKQAGKETLVDNFSFSGDALAQADWTDHRLIYVSQELTKPIHISGTPHLNIRVASSEPAANLSVWLVSLPWNTKKGAKITDNIITRGWADPQNSQSLTESDPLVPGQFYDLSFDLQPDDQVIAKGQQIGLMIFSSDRDFTLRPDPGTKLTVDLDNTKLSLPIVGGPQRLKQSFEE